ncbi:threonine dehydratase protein [Salinisphaera shabanensis E1L3A]|uniref:Threonine dehydratase protein n=1 Tax=Salinisphaera shabanensis E1L3A TaxID=1033802 RepID=U2EKS9_9GAMM|nr:CvpA family protein [Salinisphaera shabanensis]ERJ18862.1 threonine dehydratase protein [Salinisphaera shabanensis E1L3A]|tara:strand:- start:658 stop:1188 length:531 start_codon:yes stop_codon:yes gene_type:complete
MIWVDIAILAVVALSAIIGFFRGFLREAIGLATWILAFYLAFSFADTGALFLERWISVGSARLAVAFGVIFIVVLLFGAIINYVIARLVNQTGFAGTDRAIGGLFGVLRGIALLILLVLLAGVTPVPRDAWWQQSIFIGHLEDGALWARDFLPPDLAGAITYPEPATPAEDSSPSI